MERDFGPDLGARMNALAGAAPAFVFDLIKRHAIAATPGKMGLCAPPSRHARRRVRASADQWSRRNAPVDFLDAAAASRLTGTDRYRGAMFDRRGGDLNPLGFARGLARAAIAAGAAVHGGTSVLGLIRSDDRWMVHTAHGTVTAEHVVLATNGYTDSLWPRLRRTIVPLFGAIAASAPLPDAIASRVMPSRSVLYESGAITVYYRLDAQRRLLIGGRGPMREVGDCGRYSALAGVCARLWPIARPMSNGRTPGAGDLR